MICAEFENGLSRLLAGEEEPGEREARLAALRTHAESCSDCGDAAELLEFLSLPPAERDLVEPPPDPYWDEFEAGLSHRLARAGRPAGGGWASWAGIAAALLLAAVGLWLVFPSGDHSIPARASAARDRGQDEIPPSLESLLRAAEPDEALAVLDFLGGLSGVSEAAFEAAEPESLGLLYPDPEAMDAEARRALLDWLREREGRDRGVES